MEDVVVGGSVRGVGLGRVRAVAVGVVAALVVTLGASTVVAGEAGPVSCTVLDFVPLSYWVL